MIAIGLHALTLLVWFIIGGIPVMGAGAYAWYLWKDRVMTRVDVNAKCPSCGHRKGELRAAMIPPQPNARPEDHKPMVVHRCHVCNAGWAEPALKEAVWKNLPAPDRK